MKKLELVHDLLDKQLVDANGKHMGRVDGVVLRIDGDGPPEVEALALGFVVLAARVHPLAVRLVEWLRRWSVRRTARQLVPWETVVAVQLRRVELGVDGEKTPAYDWEHFLERRVVAKLPGDARTDHKGKNP
jgi:sporulation protein YlmC with PRC-barrel domain